MRRDDQAMTLSPREIASDLLQEAEARGKQYSVPAGLHSDDFIFWFIHDQAHMVDKRQAVEDYFRSGQEGAAFIRDLLKEWRPRLLLDALQTPGQPLTMLEFASGYGRVTRHFPSVMEDYKVTACDIHEQAVGFLRGMGLDAEQSSSVPEDLQLGRHFDVIYAFSFFTHMPRRTWQRWLAALGRHVKSGGAAAVLDAWPPEPGNDASAGVGGGWLLLPASERAGGSARSRVRQHRHHL
jgi:SAM-dependent methyltransferase